MRCFLGVDSGGTKCDAVLVSEDGEVLGWGRHDDVVPGNGRGSSGSGRSAHAVWNAIKEAVHGQQPDEVHLTGLVYWLPLRSLCDDRPLIIQTHHVREADAAFALAGEKYGVVALAGTGAFIHGETRNGRTLHLDGMGPLLGDFGSGYYIGLLAVRAAYKHEWHPRHHTSLAEVVIPIIQRISGQTDRFEMANYINGNHDRAEIAMLAKFVDAAANAGDVIAQGILDDAAAALSETLFDVVDRLGMIDEPYPLIGTGSIATRCDRYWDHLCRLTQAFAPRLQPIRPDLPPVVGTVLHAARQMPWIDQQAFRPRLLASAHEKLQAAVNTDVTST